MRVEDDVGADGGQQNGSGRAKVFDDIVRVFHHQRNHETAETLEATQEIDGAIVTVEESVFRDAGSVFDHAQTNRDDRAEEIHLKVFHPERSFGFGAAAFEKFLEVDAGEPGAKACQRNGGDSFRIIVVRLDWRENI